MSEEDINHPKHYGGEDNPYEVIKVIEAWKLNFNLGNAVKYIARRGLKMGESPATALQKAVFYLQREVDTIVGMKEPGKQDLEMFVIKNEKLFDTLNIERAIGYLQAIVDSRRKSDRKDQ